MRYYVFFISFFLLSCKSNTQKLIIGKDSTNIVIVEQDDKEMDIAIAKAQSSLSQFDSALFSKHQNYNSFAMKVRFPYGEQNGEHIWLRDIRKTKGEYVGIVDNMPEYISNIHVDDTIQIIKENISDWFYLDQDTLRGGFTIKLLRSRMSPRERAQYDSGIFYIFEK